MFNFFTVSDWEILQVHAGLETKMNVIGVVRTLVKRGGGTSPEERPEHDDLVNTLPLTTAEEFHALEVQRQEETKQQSLVFG